jgi:hypothetical protein
MGPSGAALGILILRSNELRSLQGEWDMLGADVEGNWGSMRFRVALGTMCL